MIVVRALGAPIREQLCAAGAQRFVAIVTVSDAEFGYISGRWDVCGSIAGDAALRFPPSMIEPARGVGSPSYDRGAALIVVDVQNDFADPAGGLSVADGEAVIPVINAEIEHALASGAPVFYTQDWHPPVTPHFARDGGTWPVHCVAGTWGAALHPSLRVAGTVVQKGRNGEDGYSGFAMRDGLTGETVPTELAALLRDRGTDRVVLCGLATDYCVKATALDARSLGYPTTVLTAAVRAVDLTPGDGDRAIDEMAAAGVEIAGP